MASIGGSATTSNNTTRTYVGPLIIVTTLFFMWGFVTNLNDILIPHLKRACDLDDFQAGFVQFAFFGAYFLMSIPAGKIIEKIGYKNGLLIGLVICAIGSLMFYPAASSRTFGLFLVALGVLACGVTLLQVGANPYVSILGPERTASSRLNLTQAFNSLGATLGPFVGGWLILHHTADMNPEEYEAYTTKLGPEALDSLQVEIADQVKMPYLMLAGVLLLIAVLIFLAKLPKVDQDADAETNSTSFFGIFKYRHLVLGALAIFVYVGAEVSIGSYLIRYAQIESIGGYSESVAKDFVSYYMACAMIGRFIGAALLTKLNPRTILGICGVMNVLLVALGVMTTGDVSLIMMIGVGLFNSIMFPTIFTLGIYGLKKDTKQGSSLMVMAIVGGALIPLAVGALFVKLENTPYEQYAFLVPLVCYIYIFYYGFIGSKPKGIKSEPQSEKEEVVTA